jgi:ribosomal protein S11
MQKQEKKLHIKKLFKFSKNKIKLQKQKLRLRRVLKNRSYVLNSNFQKFKSIKKLTQFSKKINIRITPNNIFCTLQSITKSNKTLVIASAGKYKVKTSKKTLRFSTKVVLSSFLEEIKSKLNSKKFFINIIGPIRIRRSILKQLAKYFRKKSLVINVDSKKCFNGCRVKKKKRKKQRGLRIYK